MKIGLSRGVLVSANEGEPVKIQRVFAALPRGGEISGGNKDFGRFSSRFGGAEESGIGAQGDDGGNEKHPRGKRWGERKKSESLIKNGNKLLLRNHSPAFFFFLEPL